MSERVRSLQYLSHAPSYICNSARSEGGLRADRERQRRRAPANSAVLTAKINNLQRRASGGAGVAAISVSSVDDLAPPAPPPESFVQPPSRTGDPRSRTRGWPFCTISKLASSVSWASSCCKVVSSSPPTGCSLTPSTPSGRSPSGAAAVNCSRLTDQQRICAATVAANPGSAAPARSSATCLAGNPAAMSRDRLRARSSPQPTQPAEDPPRDFQDLVRIRRRPAHPLIRM
jgi:hypothetical protein